MNILETSSALALAQAYDNRTVGEANVRAWHLILADLAAADVMEAIRRHYAADSAWIMPAHIVRLAGEIGQERAKAARQWAPGQHGVPKEEALPEITRGERLTADDISPEVVTLLGQLRSALPDVDRGRLFPRQAAWDREQRAFQRSQGGEANPHYRHRSVDDRLRDVCRVEGAHDSGEHAEGCPDAPFVTCQLCGARSQDLAGHHRDYPNGSCV